MVVTLLEVYKLERVMVRIKCNDIYRGVKLLLGLGYGIKIMWLGL